MVISMKNMSLVFILRPSAALGLEIVSSPVPSNILCEDGSSAYSLLGCLSCLSKRAFLRRWLSFSHSKNDFYFDWSVDWSSTDIFPKASQVQLSCRRYSFEGKETYFFELKPNHSSEISVVAKDEVDVLSDLSAYRYKDYISIYTNVCAPVIWFKEMSTGMLKFVSPSITSLLGYSPQDFYQDSGFWESKIYSQDSKLARLSGLTSAFTFKEMCDQKLCYRVYDADGRIRFLGDEIYEYHNHEGKLVGVVGHLRDVASVIRGQNDLLFDLEVHENILAAKAFDEYVTERHFDITKLSPLITALMSFVSSSDDVFWVMSHDYSKQLYVSPSLKDFWGVDPDLFYLDSFNYWEGFIHPEDRDRLGNSIAARKEHPQPGAVYEERYRICSADNKVKHVYDKSFPLFDDNGRLFAFAGIARDETAIVEKQQELLVEKKRVEAALASRSRFVAMISHELKTPLNGILGLSQLLFDELTGESCRGQIEDIQSSAKHLLHIVNDLLDLAMMDENRISIHEETFSIKRLFLGLEKLVRSQISEDVEFHCHIDDLVPDWVVGDINRIRQVCQNYCSNAVKFTQHGSIQLTARLSNDSDNL